MPQEIFISSSSVSAASLRDELDLALLSPQEGLKLELRAGETPFRPVDATVLVAIVSSAGVVLGSLITGILATAAKRGSKVVILRGRSGRSIEIPADTPAPKLRECVQLAKDLDLERIEL